MIDMKVWKNIKYYILYKLYYANKIKRKIYFSEYFINQKTSGYLKSSNYPEIINYDCKINMEINITL